MEKIKVYKTVLSNEIYREISIVKFPENVKFQLKYDNFKRAYYSKLFLIIEFESGEKMRFRTISESSQELKRYLQMVE